MEKLAAASGRRRWPICWCCLDRGPGSFDVKNATTLSWSSAAVSEWVSLMSVCRIIIKIMNYGRTSLLRHLNTIIYSSLVQYSTGTLWVWVMTLPRVHPWTCSRTFYRDLRTWVCVPAHRVCRLPSRNASNTNNTSNAKIPRLVGRIRSGVRVSANFHDEPLYKWTIRQVNPRTNRFRFYGTVHVLFRLQRASSFQSVCLLSLGLLNVHCFCRAMLWKRGLCRHAVSVCHVRELRQNE